MPALDSRLALPGRPRDQLQWFTVINTLDVDIPPYSIVGILDVDLDGNIYVGYPQEDDDKLVLITYEFTIPSSDLENEDGVDGTGEATNDFPWWVEYDTADGTPSRGERWGPKKDNFKAKKGRVGFLAIPMKDNAAPPIDTSNKLVYVGLEYCRP